MQATKRLTEIYSWHWYFPSSAQNEFRFVWCSFSSDKIVKRFQFASCEHFSEACEAIDDDSRDQNVVVISSFVSSVRKLPNKLTSLFTWNRSQSSVSISLFSPLFSVQFLSIQSTPAINGTFFSCRQRSGEREKDENAWHRVCSVKNEFICHMCASCCRCCLQFVAISEWSNKSERLN